MIKLEIKRQRIGISSFQGARIFQRALEAVQVARRSRPLCPMMGGKLFYKGLSMATAAGEMRNPPSRARTCKASTSHLLQSGKFHGVLQD